MAQGDPFTPDSASVSDGNTTTFDGSSSSTNAAIISEISGDRDTKLYIEKSNDGGSTWTQIAQLSDESGNATFSADFYAHFNRLMVVKNNRRLKIENADGNSNSANYEVAGDEK